MRVVVVGAGLGGVAAAVGLNRSGRLRRYDTQSRPRAGRLLRQARWMSRLRSQTGARACLRHAVLRATPKRLAIRQAASVYRISG